MVNAVNFFQLFIYVFLLKIGSQLKFLYSMKIKEQTRKLAAGCSKHRFEVVDKTDEVSDHIYGKAKLTWFEFDFRRVLGSELRA